MSRSSPNTRSAASGFARTLFGGLLSAVPVGALFLGIAVYGLRSVAAGQAADGWPASVIAEEASERRLSWAAGAVAVFVATFLGSCSLIALSEVTASLRARLAAAVVAFTPLLAILIVLTSVWWLREAPFSLASALYWVPPIALWGPSIMSLLAVSFCEVVLRRQRRA